MRRGREGCEGLLITLSITALEKTFQADEKGRQEKRLDGGDSARFS